LIFSFQMLPFPRISDITFSPLEMVLFWFLTFNVFLLAQESKRKYAYFSLLLLTGLALFNGWAVWQNLQRNELYIYKMEKGLAVDYFYHGELYSRTLGVGPQDISYKIHPNRIHKGQTKGRPLRYHEVEGSKFLALPGSALLKINGQGYEIESFS